MKVSELIDLLSELDPDIEVTVQDYDTSESFSITQVELSQIAETEEAFIVIQLEE